MAVGVGVGVGVGVPEAPDSGCQNPPVTENWALLEVAPAVCCPIVPSSLKLTFELVPPPPAMMPLETSSCAKVSDAESLRVLVSA